MCFGTNSTVDGLSQLYARTVDWLMTPAPCCGVVSNGTDKGSSRTARSIDS